jgi:pilus assembly protein CpaF
MTSLAPSRDARPVDAPREPEAGDGPTRHERMLKARVHDRLLAEAGALDLSGVGGAARVRLRLGELLRDEAPLLGERAFGRLLRELADEVAGLGPLEPLLADPAVTEVMVNGPDRVYVERAGRLEPVSLALDGPTIVRLVERVVGPLGLRLDRSSPIVDARLADGSRLHAVIPPLAPDGPCVTIRRFGAVRVPLARFGIDGAAAEFLCWSVANGWNVVVSGGTSAGKTTLLNTLSAEIPEADRVVTIEETAELRLERSHVVRLEARPANAEGVGAVSMRDLVRAALRMRPDRIVVGEVRGGEALDLLQALNTGHDGSLSTVHASSPNGAIARLETLTLVSGIALPLPAVRAQLVNAIDAVVQVRRHHGARSVEAISEVVSHDDAVATRPLFVRAGGALVPASTPTRPPRRPDAEPPDARWFG